MIKNHLKKIKILKSFITPSYRFCGRNKPQQNYENKLVQKFDDEKNIEFWDSQISQKKPNSIDLRKVVNKLYLAEALMGSELQQHNEQFFEELFDEKFIEKVYIPSEYPDKIKLVLNIAMELSVLEYQYRLNNKQIKKLEKTLEKIKTTLGQIYQYEKRTSDLGEAEFNNLVRQSQYYDMKAFYQKTMNPQEYVEFLEESTKCLDLAIQIVNDIIKHKNNNEEQLKFQIGKQQVLVKIARNFEILAEFLIAAEQEDEARVFLEKALEVYEMNQNGGISIKIIFCKCRIARSYVHNDLEKAIKLINELYDFIAQFGETELLALVAMYKFTITSKKSIDETEYEKVFQLWSLYHVSDPLIQSEVLGVALEFTLKENYITALQKHLVQALTLIQNASDKINLSHFLSIIGKVSINLPKGFQNEKDYLKNVYENFERIKQIVDDSYFWDHLLFITLIKSKLQILDGVSEDQILKLIQNFTNQAVKDDPSYLKHLKIIFQFLEKNNQINQIKYLEDLNRDVKKLL